ncbi:MAG: DNA gyrase inhibitor YacG [Burkholderiales bacterium]|nr:DNA gyrase inhibitor YacG [Burkholderiales bacterium]
MPRASCATPAPTPRSSSRSAPEAAVVNTPAPRQVPCPNCRAPTLFGAANPWRPFCSQRCRGADLGAWASERFRVPAELPTEDDASIPAAPPPAD